MEIIFHDVSFGSDPEFFFKKGEEIIGAEKVLPPEGIYASYNSFDGKLKGIGAPQIIIDGIQGELNPNAATCRQNFARSIQSSLRYLVNYLSGAQKDVDVLFAQNVVISKEEMESLSPASKSFGCQPSFNIYGDSPIGVLDPSQYYFRSAGGHIHLGFYTPETRTMFQKDPETVIKLLDVIVGNTCVMLDRDEGNAIRRRTYGRAGEYRTPKHGLEYRVLSNFWMQHYTVMSMVLALCRFAVNVSLNEAATKAVLDAVDIEKIREAINTNDFTMAQDNFNQVKEVLRNITARGAKKKFYPLEGDRIERFEKLVSKGLKTYFKLNVLEHWINGSIGGAGRGWELFIDSLRLPKEETLVVPTVILSNGM